MAVRSNEDRSGASRGVHPTGPASIPALALRDPIAIVDADSGTILEANPAMCALLGYGPDELRGLGVTDVQLELPTERAWGEHAARIKATGGGVFRGRGRCKDGSVVPIEVSINVQHVDGRRVHVDVVRDISIQTERNGRIAKTEHDRQSLANNSPDLLARFDRDLRHVFINRAVVRAADRPRDEILGKRHSELDLDPSYVQLWETKLRRAFETERPVSFDLEWESPSGTRRYEVHLVPEREPDGRIETVLSAGRDVTDLVRARDALGKHVEEQRALHATICECVDVDRPLQDVVDAVVKTLPRAMRFPERATAYVQVNGASASTPGYARGAPNFTVKFSTMRSDQGRVVVAYPEDPTGTGDPFTPDERDLLRSIAVTLHGHLERRHAVEDLRSSRGRLEAVLRSTPAIILTVDGDGVIQSKNRTAPDLTPAEAVGSSIEDWVEGENLERAWEMLDAAIGRGELTEGIVRWQGPDKVHVFQVQAGPVQGINEDLAVFSLVDRTEEAEARDALEESEIRFRQLAENVEVMFWVIEADTLRPLYISPHYRPLTRRPLPTDTSSALGWTSHVHVDDVAEYAARIDAVFAGEVGAADVEYRYRRGDGRERWFRTRAFRVEPDEQSPRVVGLTEDITTYKRSQELEQRALERRLEIRRLEKMNEFRAQFLNAAAHELNTPLTPLQLQLDLLLGGKFGPLSPKQTSALELLARNIRRLDTLVGDLFDAGKLQSGDLQIEPTDVDIDGVVRDVVTTLEASAAAGGLTIEVEQDPAVHAHADADRVSQVLLNLLSNALKFTPRGGTITIRTTRTEDTASIDVEDTGKGLTADQIDQLFQPFGRVHDLTKGRYGGTGLGLYVSQGIVETHGGTIECRSPGPGKGATFTVRLPTEDADTGDAP